MMTTRFKLTTLAIGAGLICGVPVTHADPANPSDQQKFFSDVTDQGINGPGSDSADIRNQELAMGKEVCSLDKLGRDDGEIESYLHNTYMIKTHTAQIIRVAAELNLCK
jgi:hypothetical protein